MFARLLKKILSSIVSPLVSIFRNSRISSPESLKAAEDSIVNIINAFSVLDEKSKNLEEKYPEQRSAIHQCFENAKTITPSVSVRAGKFEQVLAQQITRVNSIIDKIFTSKNEKKLNDEIKLLERYVRVRLNADSGEADE